MTAPLARRPALPTGLPLALIGALVLTPDALFMRLSGMDGLQMLGWRGASIALVYLGVWIVSAPDRAGDLARLATPVAGLVMLCQFFNALLFPVGVAAAPVAAVLIGVATVPVWSAMLSRLLYGETTGRATWLTIAVVLSGLALAVTGKGDLAPDRAALTGLACGLGVAVSLGTTFTTLRHNPQLPILPLLGIGALAAGGTGWILTGPAAMTEGQVWAILVCSLGILPLSFFALSQASRHVPAAVVSLLMLLETALGPVWVWIVLGETPAPRLLAGGTVVVVALAVYLVVQRR